MMRLLVAVTLATSMASPVFAEPSASERAAASEHYQRANELIVEQEFEEAVVEFQKAYEIAPRFEVLYNLGETYVALARPVEAVDVLTRYLRDGGDHVPLERRSAVEKQLLRQEERIAELTVSVDPQNASVEVDGKTLEGAAAAQPIRLALGPHTVSASAPDYVSKTERVTLAGEVRRSVTIHLQHASVPSPPAVAQLAITCAVPDVEVQVKGDVVGRTPFGAPLLLSTGTVTLRFRRPGYQTSERRMVLRGGNAESADCSLRPVRDIADAGRLTISTSEAEPTIELDGSPFSSGSTVPAGRHLLRVEHSGFETWQREVVAPGGKETVVNVRLTPTAAYAHSYRAAEKRRRWIAYAIGAAGIAVGGVALGLYVDNGSRYSTWKTRQANLDDQWSAVHGTPLSNRPEADQQRNDELADEIVLRDALAVGLGIGGGVLLTASVVLLLTGNDPDRYGEIAFAGTKRRARLDWQIEW